jgi:hypothetical protein
MAISWTEHHKEGSHIDVDTEGKSVNERYHLGRWHWRLTLRLIYMRGIYTALVYGSTTAFSRNKRSDDFNISHLATPLPLLPLRVPVARIALSFPSLIIQASPQ